MKCEVSNCNRSMGHKGPHGYEIEPGLIIAPHGTGTEKESLAMRFGVYRKVKPRSSPPEGHQSTGMGMLYQFLLLARNHYDGSEVVVYIPLRIEPEWAGTIRPCWIPRQDFEARFEFVSEGLPGGKSGS